jgi:hypothetical protein
MVDRATLIIGLLWALTIIAVIVVATRFVVQHKIGGLFAEDWLMLAAMVRRSPRIHSFPIISIRP